MSGNIQPQVPDCKHTAAHAKYWDLAAGKCVSGTCDWYKYLAVFGGAVRHAGGLLRMFADVVV